MGNPARRDDFPESVKRDLCDRVGGLCSKPDCRVFTKGPKAASTKAKSLGRAAHIHAAAPGGPRYLATQTRDERRAFENGIWLCANHADEVDADQARFSADELRRWKDDAEAYANQNVGRATPLPNGSAAARGLIAIGPEVLAFGRVLRTARNIWTVALDEFLLGDVPTLRGFSDSFASRAAEDCFMCAEVEGSGRLLVEGPTIDQSAGTTVELRVAAPLPHSEASERFNVRHRGPDLAVDLSGDEPDLDINREVSGADTVAQTLMAVLSTCKGGWGIDSDAGSRVAEWNKKLGSQHLASLVAIEVMRLATVPYEDTMLNKTYQIFDFVERVRSVRMLPTTSGEFVKARISMDVYGVGPVEYDVPVSLSTVHLGPSPLPDLLKAMVNDLAKP